MHPLAHIMAGALIGQLAPIPSAALAGGVLSHYVLDAVPHTEGKTFRPRPACALPVISVDLVEAGIEFFVGLAVVAWLISTCPALNTRATVFGVLGALLPDFIDLPMGFLFRRPLVHARQLHWTVTRPHALWGILTQLAVIGLAGLSLWRTGRCG